MKKISLIIAVILLAALIPLTVFAEGSASPGEETASPSLEPASGSLRIDENFDFGGGRTFGNGYMPSVNAGGTMRIILPLFRDTSAVQSDIYITPAIASDDIAFEPSNTIFGIQNSGAAWNAQFDIKAKASCYDGVYPLSFNASYKNPDGTEGAQTFTMFARITGNPAPTPTPEPTVQPDSPVSLPKLMITGYTITPEDVIAGESMNITLTVKNMSRRTAVNIELTLSSEGAVFLPKGGTNSTFIERLKGGKEETVSFDFDVKPDAEPAPCSITVDMKYEDTAVNQATASSVISIPVNQPIRVRLSDATAYGSTMDSPFTVSLNLVNMGKSTLYNVSGELSGEGLDQQTSYFGGTLAPGEQKQIELSAYAQSTSSDAMQEFSGYVTVSYEDVNGKVFKEEKPFSVTMELYQDEPIIDDPAFNPEMPVEQGPNLWWLWVLIGALIAAGLIVFFVLRGKKRRKEIEDELL